MPRLFLLFPLFVFISLFSIICHAIKPSAVIEAGTKYSVANPVRIEGVEAIQQFQSHPVYKEFMKGASEDPKLSGEKAEEKITSINRCIRESLESKMALQLSMIQCYSKTIDNSYVGFGHWTDKEGVEVLSMPSSSSKFLRSYIKNVPLDRSPEKKGKEVKDSKVHPCLLDPSSLENSCERHACAPTKLALKPTCGKDVCEPGKAYLIYSISTLAKLLSIDSKGNLVVTEHESLSSNPLYNALGLNLEKYVRKKDSPHKVELTSQDYCFTCPKGSRIDTEGLSCIDRDGCNILTEQWSNDHRECVSKYKKETTCRDIYRDFNTSLTGHRDKLITANLVEQNSVCYMQISFPDLKIENMDSLRRDLYTVYSQFIDHNLSKNKSCKNSQTHYHGLLAEFREACLERVSVYKPCYNSSGGCEIYSCVNCATKFYSLEEQIDLPNFRRSCGERAMRHLFRAVLEYKYPIMSNLPGSCSENFICPDFEVHENEVINYAIRAGYDCALHAYSPSPSQRGSNNNR